eukprot:CAMPEP_0174275076 /NCGR_PEP_ID=MMETSP0439-20130205/59630_1 /TAXON_ID=0 /ORGANISM="Stereomyxa ramosa, Strain Chinc5" /LENGTH=214 /DNA_ID=CAMNT_0015367151 /DNA_START=437 /DNA_END=1080 /DNA_ORIENTATION=-
MTCIPIHPPPFSLNKAMDGERDVKERIERAEILMSVVLGELRWERKEIEEKKEEGGREGGKGEEEKGEGLYSYLSSPNVVSSSLLRPLLLSSSSPLNLFSSYLFITQHAKLEKQKRADLIREPVLDYLFARSSPKEQHENREKSQLEVLKEQRDYKRRRQKYRAKNVHLTKRSPIQVARDYINNRMEELTAIIHDLHPPSILLPSLSFPLSLSP